MDTIKIEMNFMAEPMRSPVKRKAFLAIVMLGIIAISGCGNLSQISAEGTTERPVFPDINKASLADGTWPNLDDLRKVRSGMNKDQLFALLGHPHFSEGILGVKEWDYIFHLSGPHGVQICQYKILFDKNKIARSFIWKPTGCKDALSEHRESKTTKQSLNSDVFFAFNSAELTAQGTSELNKMVETIDSQAEINVVGYTDRLGSEAFNLDLSQRRAESVRLSLINSGLSASRIKATGRGNTKFLQQCAPMAREELIQCLAPNRRVEFLVTSPNE
jgi:outer membrane protein assembly factor BamE (lipoprotein component of BamABCDE complex)